MGVGLLTNLGVLSVAGVCRRGLEGLRTRRPASNWLRGGVGAVFRGSASGETADLLIDGGWFGWLVLDAVEVLAVQIGECGAVAGVAEEQVEHGPDEGEAAGLAGEAAHHFGATADLAERPFEQVG